MRQPFFRAVSLVLGLLIAVSGSAATFSFSTGTPNGLMATATRPPGVPIEVESADDFVLTSATTINQATFTGLIPSGAPVSSVSQVVVEIYRIFPLDSDTVRTINVPTRANSPSDVAFDSRDSAVPNLSFTVTSVSASFTANNSVLNGINKLPNQTTGGEGSVTGEEVVVTATFTTPFILPAGHYFFIPQVALSSGNFFWLSAPKPIVSPGTPFAGDLQSWIRNANLVPDWLRIGTDIVGGAIPPTFNGTFSLDGTTTSTLTVTPMNITAAEAASFVGAVASFVDSDAAQPASNYTATVDWGDGSTTAGTVAGSAGAFTVSGTHTYADEGLFSVKVTVTDAANALNSSATGTATVAEADALNGTPLAIAATQGTAFSGPVANFTDTNTGNVAADFVATIDWGDGSVTAGVVSGGGGTFAVSGTHTYALPGAFSVTVTLSEDAPGTATATVVSSAAVAAAAGTSIPTLGGGGLFLLAFALAAGGVLVLRLR